MTHPLRFDPPERSRSEAYMWVERSTYILGTKRANGWVEADEVGHPNPADSFRLRVRFDPVRSILH